ncbi:MAG: helix-turn-helix domain-containing protein [Nocardioidaceae bacterium]
MTSTLPEATTVDDVLTPVGERLAVTASRLFYARGIRAVGVELIAEEAGTTKKTIYDRFGSKDALVVVYLRRRAADWQAVVVAHLDEHPAGTGAERVLAVFDALETWLARQWRGCAFVNAYAEVAGTDHPAMPVVRAEKLWMRELFTAVLVQEGFDDADRLGSQLHLLYEGAIVTLTAGSQGDALAHARAAAARLLAG